MVDRGRGTILFTGCFASLNGIAGYSELCMYKLTLIIIKLNSLQKHFLQATSIYLELKMTVQSFILPGIIINFIVILSFLGCGKFALRALSQCLAKEFQPLGVHVAHVIIGGIVGSSRLVRRLSNSYIYIYAPPPPKKKI